MAGFRDADTPVLNDGKRLSVGGQLCYESTCNGGVNTEARGGRIACGCPPAFCWRRHGIRDINVQLVSRLKHDTCVSPVTAFRNGDDLLSSLLQAATRLSLRAT